MCLPGYMMPHISGQPQGIAPTDCVHRFWVSLIGTQRHKDTEFFLFLDRRTKEQKEYFSLLCTYVLMSKTLPVPPRLQRESMSISICDAIKMLLIIK